MLTLTIALGRIFFKTPIINCKNGQVGVCQFLLRPPAWKGLGHYYFSSFVRLIPASTEGHMRLLVAVIILYLPMNNFTFVFWTLGGTVLHC